jgi:hypothetical protein
MSLRPTSNSLLPPGAHKTKREERTRRQLDARARRFAAIRKIPLWAKIFVVAYPLYMLPIEIRFLREYGFGGASGLFISLLVLVALLVAAYYFPYAWLDVAQGGEVQGENPRQTIDRLLGW